MMMAWQNGGSGVLSKLAGKIRETLFDDSPYKYVLQVEVYVDLKPSDDWDPPEVIRASVTKTCLKMLRAELLRGRTVHARADDGTPREAHVSLDFELIEGKETVKYLVTKQAYLKPVVENVVSKCVKKMRDDIMDELKRYDNGYARYVKSVRAESWLSVID